MKSNKATATVYNYRYQYALVSGVYYVYEVKGYRNGKPYGEKIARFTMERQAQNLCDTLNAKENKGVMAV